MPGTSVLMFAGSLLGTKLAPDPSLATLPIGCMILGVAATSIPAAELYRRRGRRFGALVGIVFYILGMLCGLLATTQMLFSALILAGFLTGVSQSFVQQYRFAAVETVTRAEDIPQVLSLAMLAGVVAAWIGPEVAFRGRYLIWEDAEYAGSFIIVMALAVVAAFIMAGFKNPERREVDEVKEARPLREIAKNRLYVYAVASGAIGYGVMSFLMTATPISMTEGHHHSLADAKWVIQSHITAMFLPSLITGVVIQRLGIHKVLPLGSVILLVSLLIGFQGHDVMHYWWALVLLGFGWNWLFIGGTTLLPETYEPSERFRAQGFNDFLIFGVQALCSLAAGFVLNLWGWNTMLVLCLPLLVGHLVMAFWWVRKSAEAAAFSEGS